MNTKTYIKELKEELLTQSKEVVEKKSGIREEYFIIRLDALDGIIDKIYNKLLTEDNKTIDYYKDDRIFEAPDFGQEQTHRFGAELTPPMDDPEINEEVRRNTFRAQVRELEMARAGIRAQFDI
jgi:hypothetical protein